MYFLATTPTRTLTSKLPGVSGRPRSRSAVSPMEANQLCITIAQKAKPRVGMTLTRMGLIIPMLPAWHQSETKKSAEKAKRCPPFTLLTVKSAKGGTALTHLSPPRNTKSQGTR